MPSRQPQPQPQPHAITLPEEAAIGCFAHVPHEYRLRTPRAPVALMPLRTKSCVLHVPGSSPGSHAPWSRSSPSPEVRLWTPAHSGRKRGQPVGHGTGAPIQLVLCMFEPPRSGCRRALPAHTLRCCGAAVPRGRTWRLAPEPVAHGIEDALVAPCRVREARQHLATVAAHEPGRHLGGQTHHAAVVIVRRLTMRGEGVGGHADGCGCRCEAANRSGRRRTCSSPLMKSCRTSWPPLGAA